MHKEQIKKRNIYMFVARLFIMAHNQGTVLELGGWTTQQRARVSAMT